MAEGVQFETRSPLYFCYHCTRAVSLAPFLETDLICPECSGSFLEEMSPEFIDDDDDTYDDSDLDDLPILEMGSIFPRSMRRDREATESGSSSEDSPNPPGISVLGHSPLDEFLEDIVFRGNLANAREEDILPLRFGSDFSDDVDALATQLLDEMVVSGPPPLMQDQIKSLPNVTLSKEQIDNNLQCTICMDDFKMKEKAKSLPCKHLYHEKCITPWLERQSSCPNCREVVEVAEKSPRASNTQRNSGNRSPRVSRPFGFPDPPSISSYFTTSINPFRFL